MTGETDLAVSAQSLIVVPLMKLASSISDKQSEKVFRTHLLSGGEMESTEEMLQRVGKNRLLRVAEGLKILYKYSSKDDFAINAEHDVICAGPTYALKCVSIEDRRILKKLNWNVAGDETTDDDDDEDVVDVSTVDEDDLHDDYDGAYYFFT